MLSKIFTTLVNKFGGQIGRSLGLGGGIFSRVGSFATGLINNYIKSVFEDELEEKYRFQGRQNIIRFHSNAYGKVIPLVLGTARLRGSVIWAAPIAEKSHTSIIENLSASTGKAKSITNLEEFSYYATFAVAICVGPINSIDRVWYEDQLIDLANYKHQLYLGSEDQLPSELIIAHKGSAQIPAFRGLAYIVFDSLPLADFNNQIPTLSFEVSRRLSGPHHSTEELINSMVMIPGSGEFVYDTKVHYKKGFLSENYDEPVNSHNPQKIANSIYSLDRLQFTCPNVEWISVVVCWFGNSLDAASCQVLPSVEYSDLEIDEPWIVAGYTRETATVISKDQKGFPQYGGTMNDKSVLNYIHELKRRNLKVVLYPIMLLDLPRKPWRGHITGTAEGIIDFFNKETGYNAFIEHYAKLVGGNVDAFIIGSEFKGLTKVHDAGYFPATQELVKLADRVRSLLPRNVVISYAADWSEYHSVDGWYGLDALWASSSIDFIGIDAYFPITSSASSNISERQIIAGWSSGEGYDYWTDDQGQRRNIAPERAYKNIEYWWRNEHYNPQGDKTAWRPRMKKIWFTEFGFPSIDKATNQPNVFFDPDCYDGGVPKLSTGAIDFNIQRKALRATLKYWQNSEFVERLFLWTWDARPYPAWPHGTVWRDGGLWSRGHWVNGKLGAVTLASIISEVATRAGIDSDRLDLNQLDDPVQGILIDYQSKVSDVLNLLRCSYFFDLRSRDDLVEFTKRIDQEPAPLSYKDLVPLTNTYHLITEVASDQELLGKVVVSFINYAQNYTSDFSTSCIHYASNLMPHVLDSPLILTQSEAQNIADMILNNARAERQAVSFSTSNACIAIEPTDLILLEDVDYSCLLRVISVSWREGKIYITALNEYTGSYISQSSSSSVHSLAWLAKPAQLAIWQQAYDLCLYLACNSAEPQYLYLSLTNDHAGLQNVAELPRNSTFGRLINYLPNHNASSLLIDDLSIFTIQTNKPLLVVSEQEFLEGKSTILIGKEIIAYRQITDIGDNRYALQGLMRGLQCTEDFIHNHAIGEQCILLSDVHKLPINTSLIDRPLYYGFDRRADIPLQCTIIQGQLPPVVLGGYVFCEDRLIIYWFARILEDSWHQPDPQITYYVKIFKGNEMSEYQLQEPQVILPKAEYEQTSIRMLITAERDGRRSKVKEEILQIAS